MALTKIDDARHELHCLEADLATLQRLLEAREAELRIAEARGTAGERCAARVRHNLAKAMLDEHRLDLFSSVAYLCTSGLRTPPGGVKNEA